jgi:hypothetical protein
LTRLADSIEHVSCGADHERRRGTTERELVREWRSERMDCEP